VTDFLVESGASIFRFKQSKKSEEKMPLLCYLNVQVESLRFSEKSVTLYQSTKRNIPEEWNLPLFIRAWLFFTVQ
jgi:hypothetical protein